MNARARLCGVALAIAASLAPFGARADDPVIENAKRLLAAGNAKQAYTELSAAQDKLGGMPEFDYLLGVAALDSGRIDESIIAFERVLALIPNHAGAQMDIARAYYAAGSYDLAEAAFVKLRESNPPPAAEQAITRYLESIQSRRRQIQAGWTAMSELGLGWDSNITGVPADFGAAAQQSFNLSGIQATGNSVKRSAPFVHGALIAEYSYPLSRGWSLFAGGEVRGRAYRHESDFDIGSAEAHAGGALNQGQNQWRASASYAPYFQQGAAPGDPKPTNDRRFAGATFDWRHALDPKTQLGATVQANRVRFPRNPVEDFDQAYAAASWLRSFERTGVPVLYLTAFGTIDRARNDFDNGVSGRSRKSKSLAGVRSYFQYSITPKLAVFNGLGVVYRRDKEAFARSTTVEKGRDVFGEANVGINWQFREKCALRMQYAYSRNHSNIDLFTFDRSEVTSTIRCDLL